MGDVSGGVEAVFLKLGTTNKCASKKKQNVTLGAIATKTEIPSFCLKPRTMIYPTQSNDGS